MPLMLVMGASVLLPFQVLPTQRNTSETYCWLRVEMDTSIVLDTLSTFLYRIQLKT